MTIRRPLGRRSRYNRVSTDNNDDDEEHLQGSDEEMEGDDVETDEEDQNLKKDKNGDEDDDDKEEESDDIDDFFEDEDDANLITVIVLDPVQSRFKVKASTQWPVSKFKLCGERVHKVPPVQQRLIYRGKLLADNSTLAECGISSDNIIVHLFPKPRVVVLSNDGNKSTNDSASSSCNNGNNNHGAASGGDDDDGDDDNNGSSGAHIPQIVLDADEAERRSSILVLGSPYFVEAQNNVKLLSFLLLVFSSIELLNLFATLMGVPEDQTEPSLYDDSFFPSHNTYGNDNDNGTAANYTNSSDFSPYSSGSSNNPYGDDNLVIPQWHMYHNFDLIISAVGFWVAMTGIQATNDNTLRLAKKYMYGTFLVGVAWMVYNYIRSVQIDEEIEHHREESRETKFGNQTHHHSDTTGASSDDMFMPMSDSDIYAQSFQVMVLPGMVWILCCVRAWQFHYLLSEAEREAEERIRTELSNDNDIEQGNTTSIPTPSTPLELQ